MQWPTGAPPKVLAALACIAYARGIEKVVSMVKVLFIDDDPQAHATLRVVLPDSYVLLSAYTGRQGVETAAREEPDVVLLDISLPDMDGLHALRQIAARPLAPPIVLSQSASSPIASRLRRVIMNTSPPGRRRSIFMPWITASAGVMLRGCTPIAPSHNFTTYYNGTSRGYVARLWSDGW